MKRKKITVALVGNQNSGKTSLFNHLVGARQKVGNYPGVTVEKIEGSFIYKDIEINCVDLPGIYSLIPYTPEERVSLDFIVNEKPDIILNVADANNLERNLYLTTQLMDLELPMLTALSIYDETPKNGVTIDVPHLSELFGLPLVPISVKAKTGMIDLKEMILSVSQKQGHQSYKVEHYQDIENSIGILCTSLSRDHELAAKHSCRWLSLKLLERDPLVYSLVSSRPIWLDVEPLLKQELKALETHFETEILKVFVESRYAFIRGALKEALTVKARTQKTLSHILDDLLIHRVFGLPIFFGILWLLFHITFTFGAIPMSWLESLFGLLGSTVKTVLPASPWRSLIADGIIAGVGGVLVFVPNILILFFGISILEGTGYFARAAFVVDRIMHKIGLHGKSFIPMILGFGCSVPAFMACRTLKSKADRLTTMLILPFISCSAKLPVYVLLISAFFPVKYAGTMLFGIHMFGVFIALIMAMLLKKVLFKSASEPFVMELPPYRMPSLKNICIHTWEKTVGYLRKAGTTLLFFAILIWALSNYPTVPTSGPNSQLTQIEYSMAGRMGKIIEPLIRPLGFDWKIGVALVAGFAAKEVVVTTLSTIYSVAESAKSFAVLFHDHSGMTPLNALTLMVFVLLYVPCMAATAVFHKEVGEVKWTWMYVFYTTGTAYIVSFIVFSLGRLLGY